MISCDKGQITIEGYKPAIMAELTSFVHALIEDDGEQVLTKEELDNGIKSMADKMSPEQLLGALISTLEDISS